MKTRPKLDRSKSFPPHFVIYDYKNPSPLFTPEQIERIESIKSDFDEEDLRRIRKIEVWVLNTNTGWLNSPAIPGLRSYPNRGHRYLRRFSEDRYEKMIDTFLDRAGYAFPRGDFPCHMPGLRVVLPNGDKFYPIDFHDDLEKCVRLLDEAAAFFGTQLGQFSRGKFVVSNGDVYPFSSIAVDELEITPAPKDW